MRLTEAREGKNRTQVLAAIADSERRGGRPIQKDLVEELPMTKGAVSQNCSRLVEESLLREEAGQYSVNRGRLVIDYREHFEEYLRREPRSELYQGEVEERNEFRTRMKRRREDYFDSPLLEAVLISTLIHSLDKNNVQTLREVFLYTDEVLQRVAYRAADSDVDVPEELEPVIALAACRDDTTAIVEEFASRNQLKDVLAGESPETYVAKRAKGGS